MGGSMSDATVDVAPPGHSPPSPTRKKIQVVPLRGLPIVALAVVFVAVAIATNWQWALMFSHVAGGGVWTGIDLFVGLVIGPILGRLSIPARAEFAAWFMPKMVIIMPTIVMMTLATGFQIARQLGNLKID